MKNKLMILSLLAGLGLSANAFASSACNTSSFFSANKGTISVKGDSKTVDTSNQVTSEKIVLRFNNSVFGFKNFVGTCDASGRINGHFSAGGVGESVSLKGSFSGGEINLKNISAEGPSNIFLHLHN